MDIRFCFKVNEKASIAIDSTGNTLAPSYLQMIVRYCDHKTIMKDTSSKEYKKDQKYFQDICAIQSGLPVEYVIPISTKEYDLNNG